MSIKPPSGRLLLLAEFQEQDYTTLWKDNQHSVRKGMVFNMKKLYIITGAAGHLGGTVIGMLKGKDCEVRGLILPEEQAEDTENVTFYKGDVTKPDTLRPLFENRYGKETYVIHTAGIVDIQNAVSPLIYNVNVNGTKISSGSAGNTA